MNKIGKTLILEPHDLKKDATEISLFAFDIPIAEINKAENIIYISDRVAEVLKVKRHSKLVLEN